MLTCSTLIVDGGPSDRPVAVLGARGGPLGAAISEEGPDRASVAV